ncbi:MAG: hypothetical protein RLN69_05165 [Woeseiaceae bacterium]
MEYIVGSVLALVVLGGLSLLGFDRDRAFYPTVTIVVATYYILFAALTGSSKVMLAELTVAVVFIVLAVLGFKKSPWILVAALAGHGAFDLVHHRLIVNPGVPDFWPGFCMAFDVVAAAYLAVLLVQRSRQTG